MGQDFTARFTKSKQGGRTVCPHFIVTRDSFKLLNVRFSREIAEPRRKKTLEQQASLYLSTIKDFESFDTVVAPERVQIPAL